MSTKTLSLAIDWDAIKRQLVIKCPNQLDIHSVGQLWQSAFDALQKYQPQQIMVEAQKVSYCDSAGISFLLELKKHQQTQNRQFSLLNLNPRFQQLLDKIEAIPVNMKHTETEHLSFIARL